MMYSGYGFLFFMYCRYSVLVSRVMYIYLSSISRWCLWCSVSV